MTDKPTQTDAELQSIIDDADAGPPTDNEWLCLECGRWTPWRHEEAHDHADGCKAPAIYAARRDWKARLNDYMAKWGIPAGRATAAPAQPAAQLGVAYAEMPTSNYAGRVYEEGFLTGTCPLYTADQMRAFADATHALRVSHGQAPAGAGMGHTDGGRNMFYEGRFDGESKREQQARLRWANDMRAAFERHTGNGWFDKDWRTETGLWSSAWHACLAAQPTTTAQAAPQQEAQEPVAWLHTNRLGEVQAFTNEPPPSLKAECQELYTAPQPSPAAQGDALPREDFAWLVVQEACETEPADEDDPECVRILRRDLKSSVLAAFLRLDAARAAQEGKSCPKE